MAASTRTIGWLGAGILALGLSACGDKDGDNWLNGDFDDTGEGGDEAGSGTDNDNDGYDQSEDCRDNDPESYPGAEEVACDGIDQDCDGEDLLDGDGDGHDCPAYGGDDCDDSDASISPSATEVWYDSIDQDCDDNDTDADGDGYVGETVGGDDCDDNDAGVNPGITEVCYDEIDNDCSDSTGDCDCDLDGADAIECGGTDCDDEDPEVDGTGDEDVVDGVDNDCDDEIDEDAYCNLYYPTSMDVGHELDYESTGASGTVYTELWTIDSWDGSTGAGVVQRSFSDSSGNAFVIKEDITCDGGIIEVDGWDLEQGGAAVTSVSYSAARQVLAADSDLIEGETWEFAYEASDSLVGDLWAVEGVTTVGVEEEIAVTAGTFTALKLETVYTFTDASGYFDDREGTVSAWYTKKLGLVYSEDIESDGSEYEVRQLTAYYEYFPE